MPWFRQTKWRRLPGLLIFKDLFVADWLEKNSLSVLNLYSKIPHPPSPDERQGTRDEGERNSWRKKESVTKL